MKTIFSSILFSLLTTLSFGQYNIGDKVPMNFSLKNATNAVNGISKDVTPSTDYKNVKGFIVIFTCNTCPFSVAYEDRINDLHNKYASQGYPVIAINPNSIEKKPKDDFENMIKRAKAKNFKFAYLRDETQEVAKAFDATRTPHIYIVQKHKSDFHLRYIGAIDDNSWEVGDVKEKYAESAIDALLAGEEIEQAHTKAVGCTIKW